MDSSSNTGFCKLSQFALISITGADAISFLQSQLTNDIKLLPENKACLAGYCTPKGRLLASMLVWKSTVADEQTVTLQVPAELQESFQKRLSMFIMRAKVKLDHITGSHVMLGIIGHAAATQLADWFPELPSAPYDVVHNEKGILIRLTDAVGQKRYQWMLAGDLYNQIEPSLSEKITLLPEYVWARSEIQAGIPHITLATQEKWVPQMINYELIGGVSFKKGCYPGQEIVARSHYLGKQKRRMVLAEINTLAIQNGMDVFSGNDPDQPCGMVVNTQPNERGGSDCLIEIKTSFLTDSSNGKIMLSSGDTFHWLPLPYSLPDE